jgi:hypothetical protein
VHQEKSGNPACVGLIDFLALYNIIKSVFWKVEWQGCDDALTLQQMKWPLCWPQELKISRIQERFVV